MLVPFASNVSTLESKSQEEITKSEIANNFQFGYQRKMMKWNDRVKIIMKAKGITPADLVKLIGEQAPNITRYLNGTRGQDSISVALKFAKALGEDPVYLLFGEQKPIRKVSHKLVIEKLQKFEVFEKESPFSSTKYVPIRLLKDAIAAGHPTEIIETDIDGWALIYANKEWMPNEAENYTCARIKGYSMWPILAPGDIVAIDHADRDPNHLVDKMVAFRKNGGTTIKWFRYHKDKHIVIGEPENRDERETTIILDANEAYENIVGKVAWWWAKR